MIPPTKSPDELTPEPVRPDTPDLGIVPLKTAGDVVGPTPPSRWWLRLSAAALRAMNCIGMARHFRIRTYPPDPSFTKSIPSTLSKTKGDFNLQFYTPKGYDKAAETGQTFPGVINFHGGGFTIGNATDDARFGRYVIEEANAVFISVDYRLSPEYPFPVAVEDATDALLYVIRNAAELHIDALRLATTGFSAGGNLAFTSLLLLSDYLGNIDTNPAAAAAEPPVPDHEFIVLASWYPVTDYTIPRAVKRAKSPRPDLALPAYLTDLFDACYLGADPSIDLANPYLSPACATDEHLDAALPGYVWIHACEWDMLLHEGRALAQRLCAPRLGRDGGCFMLDGTTHAWDKAPSFGEENDLLYVEFLYQRCAWDLRDVFAAYAEEEGGEREKVRGEREEDDDEEEACNEFIRGGGGM